MNRTLINQALAVGTCLALAGTAFATQPPDVVTSDGSANTAMGSYTLSNFASGAGNTAAGYAALYYYGTQNYSTAFGAYALELGQGSYNTAVGVDALYQTSGSSNTALGDGAGSQISSGSWNIDIGNSGTSGDNGVIRIGSGNKTNSATYIFGISNSQIIGAAVYITSGGQLGVLASSKRYKTAIKPLRAGNTEKLMQLRPVSFHLKHDPSGPMQYGLIAEEVVKVYPELVIRDEAGKIQGVRYDELGPMLLSEMQQQQQINLSQAAEIRQLKGEMAELNNLKQEIRAALISLQSKDRLTAQR